MYDVMIDIETMSLKPNAAVASIGAIAFPIDRVSIEIDSIIEEPTFSAVLDLRTQRDRDFDPDTLYWWLSQSTAAQAGLLDNPRETTGVLSEFRRWVRSLDVRYGWSNGANFDHVILQHLFQSRGIEYPFRYTRQLCFRTMKNLIEISEHETHVDGPVAHRALDDAIVQARHLQLIFEKMRGLHAQV
jgi:hypothetical protein